MIFDLHLTWKAYLAYCGAAGLLYYGWLGIAYYRKDIVRFFNKRSYAEDNHLPGIGAGSSPPEDTGQP
ncbi:MAG: hypothetical protein EPN39_00270 [Chitinophagaceae bacterium]|nr:MAG: hypothetical protein EPN39_00270 [Chitinophagaceae bacterium]